MTRHGPALLALSVLAIAGWTYNVNYDTRAALDRLSDLRGRIAEEREALQVLRVEWAWLNAPDRLSRLVAEHDDELALVALTPEALGIVAAVPYPPAPPSAPEPPAEAPEALIAAAPQAPADAAMPTQVSDALVASAGPAAAAMLTGAPTAAAAQPARADRSRVADATPAAAHRASGGPAGPGAPQLAGADTTAAPATRSEKAVLTERARPPATMQEAVALALAEAGIVDAAGATAAGARAAGGTAAGATIIAASASPDIPMPQARPAVWVGR